MTVGDQGFQLGVSDGIYSAGTLPIGTSLPVNTTYSEAVRIVNIEGAPGCLAFGVTAERPAGSSSPTTPYFFSEDDCTGTRVTMTMDATWQSKYARVLSGGRLEYIAQTVSCGTLCRWVLLYNFSAAAWDAVLYQ